MFYIFRGVSFPSCLSRQVPAYPWAREVHIHLYEPLFQGKFSRTSLKHLGIKNIFLFILLGISYWFRSELKPPISFIRNEAVHMPNYNTIFICPLRNYNTSGYNFLSWVFASRLLVLSESSSQNSSFQKCDKENTGCFARVSKIWQLIPLNAFALPNLRAKV